MISPGEDSYPDEPPVLSRKEQNARSFLIFIVSVLTILLLGFFLYLPLDTFTRILALLGMGAVWMVGFILLDKRRTNKASEAAVLHQQPFREISEDHEADENETLLPEQEIQTSDMPEDEKAQDELRYFEQLVQEALDSIPEEFHQQMENLVVIVEDEPDAAMLAEMGASEGQTLLGLYHGVPLTHFGHQYASLPERITIYQRTIERYCHGDPERIREQVRATVLHEVAHHFGIEHDEMPIWVK